jgi:hypothetical protein
MNKKIKDMTVEEYKEYRRKYAKEYNERKKKEKEKNHHDNVIKKLKGKAKKHYISEMSSEDEKNIKKIDDNKFNLINWPNGTFFPLKVLYNSANLYLDYTGFDAFIEVTGCVEIRGEGKDKKIILGINIIVISGSSIGRYFKTYNIWEKDITYMKENITSKNYFKELLPMTQKECSEIKKMSFEKFITTCIEYCNKEKQEAVDIIWSSITPECEKKYGITLEKINSIADVKVNKNKIIKYSKKIKRKK